MRADRLISILMLLQGRGPVTAREIARRLEVSERTIHRDMEALSTAGVPVYAVRGAGGGWALPEGYRTQLTGLTEAELQALFAARPERMLADLGLGAAGQGAELKLLAAIPQSRRSEAERMLERVHIDAPSWRRPAESTPLLPNLQQALWADRRVSMHYRRADGSASERVVDPLGLVAKGNLWYLVARQGEEVRTFRASRVEAVTILDEAAQRPEGFDLPSWWAASSRSFLSALPRYTVSIRAAPDILPQIRRPGGYVEIEPVGEPDADGWQRLDLHFEIEDDACGYVLSFGSRVEIMGPERFRERVVALARDVVARYESET